MKKSISLFFLFVLFLSACSDSSDNGDADYSDQRVPSKGVFVLNNGHFGANNSSLVFYDKTTESVLGRYFENANNGLKLGDTAQDLLIVDDNVYIAVFNSRVIYVTDKSGRVKKEIISANYQYPRSLAADDNYVYVAYFDGFLARIDRNTLEPDMKQVAVGRNPEDVNVSNGKIYVANSGGLDYPNYDNRVSVVDAITFTKERDVQVVINPTQIEVATNGMVYVISSGNYDDITNSLQSIDPQSNYEVESIGYAGLMRFDPSGTKLYTIYSPIGGDETQYKIYSVAEGVYLDETFVNHDVVFSATPTCLDIDPETNDIYIGTTDYRNNADMYIISAATGTVKAKFNTQGLNPMGAYFLD